MKCDWCGRERPVVAVHLSRDNGVDGGPEELIEDGYRFPGDERGPGYGQACSECVEAKFVRQLTTEQRRLRHERQDRFRRAAERLRRVT